MNDLVFFMIVYMAFGGFSRGQTSGSVIAYGVFMYYFTRTCPQKSHHSLDFNLDADDGHIAGLRFNAHA